MFLEVDVNESDSLVWGEHDNSLAHVTQLEQIQYTMVVKKNHNHHNNHHHVFGLGMTCVYFLV